MKNTLNLLIFVTVFSCGTVVAQTASKGVLPGKNHVPWSGGLPVGTPTTLTASFWPARDSFIPNSGYAAPMSNGTWNRSPNGPNSAQGVTFQMTTTFALPPKKLYPTYFQGLFDIRGGVGQGKPPAWEASAGFSPFFGPHNYLDIYYSLSGFKMNHKPSKTIVDRHIDYIIGGTQHGFTEFLLTFLNTLVGGNQSGGDVEYNYTGGWRYRQPYIVPNIPCALKPPPTPPCTKMCRGIFEIIGEVESEPVIHLPFWRQENNAGAQTKAAWAQVKINIRDHEEKHLNVFYNHFRGHVWWSKWAKTKQIIDVCANDAQQAQEIATEFVEDLATTANGEWIKLLEDYEKAQKAIDQFEKDNNYPVLQPMRGSNTSLAN